MVNFMCFVESRNHKMASIARYSVPYDHVGNVVGNPWNDSINNLHEQWFDRSLQTLGF